MLKNFFVNYKVLAILFLLVYLALFSVVPNNGLRTGQIKNIMNKDQYTENNTPENSTLSSQTKELKQKNVLKFDKIENNNRTKQQKNLSQGFEKTNIKVNSIQSSSFTDNLKIKISQNINSQLNNQKSQIFNTSVPLMSGLNRDINSKVADYVQYIIQQNLQRITKHNGCKNQSYKLRQNKFIIYTKQQFKSLFLTLQQPDKNYTKHEPQQFTVILPQSDHARYLQQQVNINWKTAKKMTSVKYQMDCGACYSFTALGAIQSAYVLSGQFLNLAEQQIIDCSSSFGNQGCVGGWTINAYKYIQQYGVLYQSDYPFKAVVGNCSIAQNKTKYFIKQYVQLKSSCSLVIQALKNQPLSIAVNANDWQYYSTGVYTNCQLGPSNHGVVLAGVDGESWLVKNSWGFSWGQQGYIRIGRTAPNGACNVCKWASYPVL